jgi:hypothetical protein
MAAASPKNRTNSGFPSIARQIILILDTPRFYFGYNGFVSWSECRPKDFGAILALNDRCEPKESYKLGKLINRSANHAHTRYMSLLSWVQRLCKLVGVPSQRFWSHSGPQ